MTEEPGVMLTISIDRIIDSLQELSDQDEQRRLWLSTGANGAEVSSFVEAVERLFTDSGLSYELERASRAKRGGRDPGPDQPVFDERTDSLFGRLLWLTTKIDANRPPHELIDDPVMEQIRVQASDLLTAMASLR